MQDGEVVHPRIFSGVVVTLSIVNFALGAIASVTRFALVLPFAFLKFHLLDESLLDEDFVQFDFGVMTYLTCVMHNYEKLNPVRRGFLRVLMPDAHRLYGPLPSSQA